MQPSPQIPSVSQVPLQVERTQVPGVSAFGALQAQPIGQLIPRNELQAPPQPSASRATQVPS